MTAVTVRELRIGPLRIPFKTSFRHASAERAETSSIWAAAVSSDGVVGYGESCPRPYVTGETIETAAAFARTHRNALLREVRGLETMRGWMEAQAGSVDRNPAAWCAIELALLDMFAKTAGVTVDALLGLPPPAAQFRYTAVVGDGPPEVFSATAERYRQLKFTDFKIKLSGHEAADQNKAALFRRWGDARVRLRVDANNLWTTAEQAITFLRKLPYPLFAVEEPIRANQYDELLTIARALDCRIVLDESLLRAEQVASLPGGGGHWLANVRVSKMGGLLRSLEVVRQARGAGVGVIVGAQVGETSLLTRAALTVASAAGSDLVAQEGAFGTHLLEYDVCDPPLMFGAAGVLDVATGVLNAPGFGLRITAPLGRAQPSPAADPAGS